MGVRKEIAHQRRMILTFIMKNFAIMCFVLKINEILNCCHVWETSLLKIICT